MFQKGARAKEKADLTRLVIGYTQGQKTLTFLRLRTTHPIVMEYIPQSQQTINLGVMEEEQRIKCYGQGRRFTIKKSQPRYREYGPPQALAKCPFLPTSTCRVS